MSIRLRELIRNVRACKTQADERACIHKECAAIRTAFKEESNELRHRNVAKLLFIHMLGYPTHWGQMECLKLVAGTKFPEKRVGYLGLMILLDERQEVLMLVENSLKMDLHNANQYISGLAMCSLANIASTEICRDLSPEIETLLGNSNPYIRKKACICAIRILKKNPELAENYVDKVASILADRNHGVLLTGAKLMYEMTQVDASTIEPLRKQVPTLVRVLKNLVLSGYAPEHDINGITDPFLQVALLKLLRILGRGSAECSDMMNDILAQVATNTESSKNVGNAILYECVLTIVAIEAESGLRVLAINILGRFLGNRDNNIRYVALNTLVKVVDSDVAAVQRHRATIVDCLKDADVSLRRRALELIIVLVNESNVESLVGELLAYLPVVESEYKEDLVTKICSVVEGYAPEKQWRVDTIIKTLTMSGAYVSDELASSLVSLISKSPEIQAYTTSKLHAALSADLHTVAQTLVQVGVWCLGEYADLVREPPMGAAAVSPSQTLDLLDKVLHSVTSSLTTKECVLNALVKLSARYAGDVAAQSRVRELILPYRASIALELQQRAVEYASLFQWDGIRAGVLERMPPMEKKAKAADPMAVAKAQRSAAGGGGGGGSLLGGDLVGGGGSANGAGGGGGALPARPAGGEADLLADILGGMDMGGGGGSVIGAGDGMAGQPPQQPLGGIMSPVGGGLAGGGGGGGGAGAADMLMDLLGGDAGGPPPMAQQPAMPAQAMQPMGGMGGMGMQPQGMMGGGAMAPMTATPAAGGVAGPAQWLAYEKGPLKIAFSAGKEANNAAVTNVTMTFTNSGPSPLTDFVFQAAVPKYMKMQMQPASASAVPAGGAGSVTQLLKLANSMHGQKPIVMRIKVEYALAGNKVSETGEVSNFPAGY